MKVVKQHPDRHIIRSFEKKRKPRHVWTRKENELFINTVKRCGKDYKKLKYALKTKTAEQLTSKMSLLLNQVASNPKHEHAKIFKNIAPSKYH